MLPGDIEDVEEEVDDRLSTSELPTGPKVLVDNPAEVGILWCINQQDCQP